MLYYLNESERNQLCLWFAQISVLYHEEDALRLKCIFSKALATGYFDEGNVYELLELLPKIIPEKKNRIEESLEERNSDWQEYMDNQRSGYKREMSKLHQSLSSWIFLQSAVYRNNVQPVGEELDKIIIKNENGIKKLR